MSKTRVVFILSLGLNLLVLGAVLGHAWRGGFDRGPPPLSWGLRSLSPEARAQVMPRLRENLQESRAHRRALRQAARAVEARTAAARTAPRRTARRVRGARPSRPSCPTTRGARTRASSSSGYDRPSRRRRGC